MLPKAPQTAQGHLFKSGFAAIIDLSHPSARLASKIDWECFETLHPTYVAGRGAPAINTRLMVSLHMLKFQRDLSDQAVVERWMENPYWQFFSGMRFFSHSLPLDSSRMMRWRNRPGASGAEEILQATLQASLKVRAVHVSDLKDVNLDTTVQTKNIRFPTDARLHDRMRLWRLMQRRGPSSRRLAP